jgi:hypothetical protein
MLFELRGSSAGKQRRYVLGPELLEVVAERSAEELRPALISSLRLRRPLKGDRGDDRTAQRLIGRADLIAAIVAGHGQRNRGTRRCRRTRQDQRSASC